MPFMVVFETAELVVIAVLVIEVLDRFTFRGRAFCVLKGEVTDFCLFENLCSIVESMELRI